ncbi:flagellar type III secretion system pore protein FliP [Gallaecimonas mangrovi]|uniref:flagellar type III secretion system pore protein FliP n=1 Tax=Gallaecimonas mangrovi TaxID=2291597 RepID=UPI000E2019A2|nr:flagellar type III secretion system pore protein FliP [Gallaecimonas mangrovi]
MKRWFLWGLLLLPIVSFANPILPDGSLPAVTVTNTANGGQEYSVTLQVLLLMTLLTFIPAILMMMTAFTRIVVVLGILRQALGLQQVPSNQVIMGISLFMTFFVMSPVFDQIYNNAVQPYSKDQMTFQQALVVAQKPLKTFMLKQTRETDVKTFASMAGVDAFDTPQDVPMRILIPAFVTSELKTAFQIGFMLFIPFLIIDLVVASVLMAMGMMMLSPMIVSLPFKLMLFVLVDGWNLILGTLARSFA